MAESENISTEKKLNKFKIIAPFYNCAQYLENCVSSILTQDYEGEFSVLFIDDCSTDNGRALIPSMQYKFDEQGNLVLDENGEPIILYKHPLLEKTKCKEVKLWVSSERVTALPNLHNAFMQYCTDPDDIVVICDADDMLIGKKVLTNLNDFYNEHDCWISWGSSRWSNGGKCCAAAYTEEEYSNVRKSQFKVSHLRSFRAGLYHSIGKQDEMFDCLKEKSDGTYYKKTYDVAQFVPMLEMTPFEKAKYNSKVMYFYNRENPINDDKNGGQFDQTRIHIEITQKKPFKKIKDYKTGETV